MKNPVLIVVAALVMPWLWGWGVDLIVRKLRLYRYLPEPQEPHGQPDDDQWYYQI